MTPVRKEVIGDATLYLGDAREIVPTLTISDFAVVTDPPYGMKLDTDSRRFTGGSVTRGEGRDWGAIVGDNEAPDLSFLPPVERIIFGYNHLAAQLGKGACLVWIKQNPWSWGTFLSDAELAWKSTGCGVYCLQHTVKGTDFVNRGEPKWHPTEKPVPVMAWAIGHLRPITTILDPYMGSGSTALAALQLGRRFVGIEIEPRYFDAACERTRRCVDQGDLLRDIAPKAKPVQEVML